jgi:hypothetical protein
MLSGATSKRERARFAVLSTTLGETRNSQIELDLRWFRVTSVTALAIPTTLESLAWGVLRTKEAVAGLSGSVHSCARLPLCRS